MNKSLMCLVALSVLTSCGVKKEKSSSSKPVTFPQELESEQQNPSAHYSNLSLKELVNKMAQDSESFKNGIPSLRAKLNSRSLDLENKEAYEIANLLSQYSDDTSEKLKLLLGLQDNQTGEDSIAELNQIYLDLLLQDSALSESMESVLVQYLSLSLLKYESQFTTTEDISEIVEYYKNKVQEEATNSSASNSFEKYSMLYKVVDSSAYDIFQEIFKNIQLNLNSSISSQNAYRELLKEYLLKNNNFNDQTDKRILTSAKRNIEWSSRQDLEDFKSVSNYLESLSNYYSLFDLNQTIVDKSDLQDRINNLYFDIVSNSKPVLTEIILKNDTSHIQNSNLHPYLKVEINRVLIRSNQEPLFTFNNSRVINREFHSQRMRIEEDSSANMESNRFMTNYFDIIAYKHSLELASLKGKHTSSSQDIYNSLFSSLIDSLNYLYDKDITKDGLYSDSSMSFNLFDQIENEYQGLEKDTFKISYCKGDADNCPTKTFIPGIYSAPKAFKQFKNIEMYGASIDMHPLALIITKGANISLNFENYNGLWIDTKGRDGQTVSIPQIENRVKFPSFVKMQRNGKRKRGNKQYYIYDVIVKNGVSPQDQNSATDGVSAGKMTIHTNYKSTITSIPLINISGGRGGNGANGLDAKSPIKQTITNLSSIKIKKNSPRYNTSSQIVKEGTCKENITLKTGSYGITIKKIVNDHRERTSTTYDTKKVNRLTNTNYKIYRGKGGNGGNGAQAGSLSSLGPNSQDYDYLLNNTIAIPGKGGKGGAAGNCGSGNAENFKGVDGQDA